MSYDPSLLIGFATRQFDTDEVFIDPHERKAQIGLARITLRVAVDEASPDPVAQQRADARVDDGRPDHETGDGIVPVGDAKAEVPRNNPKHARENNKHDRGLDQSGAEIG